MLLEKSSFHIRKTSIQPNTSADKTQKSNKEDEAGNEKTFWSWFKGLINPLQNLPIISGIYSSLNSDNPESDRDLVQNSLGGFLYGGPFGAIAGFGTWAFNKIFDKTPAEFAFDFSGISNLWKKDKEEPIETAAIDSESGRLMQISKLDKNNTVNKFTEKDINNLLGSRKELSIREDKTYNQNSKIIQRNKTLMDKTVINSDNQEKKVIENKPSFRKIEFNYPEWKPQLQDSKQVKHLSESEKNFYESLIKKENDIKKNLLIKIDA